MPHSEHIIHIKKPHIFQKKLSPFDKAVLFVSIAYPLSALPQAITVFDGKIEGVSLISWLSFMVCALLFLVYGIKNKVFPMIVSNTLWILMDAFVVTGLLLQS